MDKKNGQEKLLIANKIFISVFANSVASDVLVNVIWNIVSLQDSFVKIVLQTQILG